MKKTTAPRVIEGQAEDVPEGWEQARVDDLVTLVNGFPFKPAQWKEHGLPIIRIQNLNNSEAKFNHCSDKLPEKFLVSKGNLLFAWSGTPGTSFGAHIWEGGQAWLNQHIFRVDFNETLLSKTFLRLAINHNLNAYIHEAHGGVGLAHITKGNFEASSLLIPPLQEQHRIADRVQSLIAEQSRCLQRLDRVSRILKVFRQSVLAAHAQVG